VRESKLHVRWKGRLPCQLVKVVRVDKGCGENTGVHKRCVGLVYGSTTVLLDEGDEIGREVRAFGDLERGEIGTVGGGWDLADASKGSDSAVAYSSRLGISDGVGRLDETRQKLW